MALPVLNEAPKYQMNIPSTGQTVRFRPFLVKEEKVMMVAMESENPSDILNTVTDTISACVIDELDTSKLTTFDVEYCFLKIRSKSAGEKADMIFKCEKCESENEVSINIDDLRSLVKKNAIIFDGRRYFSKKEISSLQKMGLSYLGVGRKFNKIL